MEKYIDGFKCYDIELAVENDDFESKCYPAYQKYVPDSFWYKSRNRIIEYLISSVFKKNKYKSFLEIGCGNGFVLQHLSKSFLSISFSGCDIYIEALKYCRSNNDNDTELFQYNVFKNNLDLKYDCIGLFDVIEHIENDNTVLQNVGHLLNPGGSIMITIPADMRLWSNNDVVNKHKRRYNITSISKLLSDNGFEVTYSNYFVFWLFPVLWLKAKIQKYSTKKNDFSTYSTEDIAKQLNLKINPILNFMFYQIMKLELFWIKQGFKFSIGSSIVIVGKYKS